MHLHAMRQTAEKLIFSLLDPEKLVDTGNAAPVAVVKSYEHFKGGGYTVGQKRVIAWAVINKAGGGLRGIVLLLRIKIGMWGVYLG